MKSICLLAILMIEIILKTRIEICIIKYIFSKIYNTFGKNVSYIYVYIHNNVFHLRLDETSF